MKKLSICMVALCMLFVSCAQPDDLVSPNVRAERVAKLGVLQVGSQAGFAALVDAMKEAGTFDVRDLPQTRNGEAGADDAFVSLRQHLIEQGLREFTDAELAEIMADSLEYDPEDSLIVDPYMMALLNENREVQIADKIYRYINEGLLIYDAPIVNGGEGHIFSPDDIVWPDSLAIQEGESTVVQDSHGNFADLLPIDYIRGDFVGDNPPGGGDGSGGGGSTGGDSDEDIVVEQQGITLADGQHVSDDYINKAVYEKGSGEASWLQKGISGLFGTNVVVVNKFNSNHRMKLRMFDMDYLIYKSCGMTVRMQKKKFGIWWRKKAQEFRYGWSAIEIEHTFNKAIFETPPVKPDGTQATSKYPELIKKSFQRPDLKVLLFHIPFMDYDMDTGDINILFNEMLKKVAGKITSWMSSAIGSGDSTKPVGLYTVFSDDCKMLTIYPQCEKVSYDDGREVVRWESEWDFGFVNLGFFFGGGNGVSMDTIDFDFVGHKMDIKRGQIYAAVRYNNEWRMCAIETK